MYNEVVCACGLVSTVFGYATTIGEKKNSEKSKDFFFLMWSQRYILKVLKRCRFEFS